MEFTREQVAEFAKSYFRETPVSCPTCEAPLTVTESGVNREWHSVAVTFTCRRCSTSAWDDGRERAETGRPYSDQEKKQILDAHWRELRPRCPIDESYLTVGTTHTTGGVHFSVRCKYCGSNFQQSPSP
jgi:transposase-like protein